MILQCKHAEYDKSFVDIKNNYIITNTAIYQSM